MRRLWIVVLTASLAGCGAGEIYNNNLTMLQARSEIFRGLEVGMLRPEALAIAGRAWPGVECEPLDQDELCWADATRGGWPGRVDILLREGRVYYAMFSPDSAAFMGVTPRALVARIDARGITELVQRGDQFRAYWGSDYYGMAVMILCDDLESVTGCMIMLGPWPQAEESTT
jgi:hypothetical protein